MLGSTIKRAGKILTVVGDLVLSFLIYDRKDDENLPRGVIQKAIDKGDLDPEDIVKQFRVSLYEELGLDLPEDEDLED